MTTVRDTKPPPVETWPRRACEGADTRVFFPGMDGGGRQAGLEALAKRLCVGCAALKACKAYAVPIKDLAGVWAGMNEGERARARKKQQKEAG